MTHMTIGTVIPEFIVSDSPASLLAILFYGRYGVLTWPSDWDAEKATYVIRFHLADLRRRDPREYVRWWDEWFRTWIFYDGVLTHSTSRLADFFVWYESVFRES
jgi:hypothetical protein